MVERNIPWHNAWKTDRARRPHRDRESLFRWRGPHTHRLLLSDSRRQYLPGPAFEPAADPLSLHRPLLALPPPTAADAPTSPSRATPACSRSRRRRTRPLPKWSRRTVYQRPLSVFFEGEVEAAVCAIVAESLMAAGPTDVALRFAAVVHAPSLVCVAGAVRPDRCCQTDCCMHVPLSPCAYAYAVDVDAAVWWREIPRNEPPLAPVQGRGIAWVPCRASRPLPRRQRTTTMSCPPSSVSLRLSPSRQQTPLPAPPSLWTRGSITPPPPRPDRSLLPP